MRYQDVVAYVSIYCDQQFQRPFFKSRNIPIVDLSSWKAFKIWSVKFEAATVVDLPSLKPNWVLISNSFVSK